MRLQKEKGELLALQENFEEDQNMETLRRLKQNLHDIALRKQLVDTACMRCDIDSFLLI